MELLLKVNLGKSFTCFLLPPHDGLYHLRTQPSRSSPDEAPQPCTRTVSWNKSYLCNLPSLQYCVISYRKQTTVRVTHHPLVIVGSKIDANWRARICFLKQINLNLERNNLREGSLSECLLSNWVYISTWEKKRKKKGQFHIAVPVFSSANLPLKSSASADTRRPGLPSNTRQCSDNSHNHQDQTFCGQWHSQMQALNKISRLMVFLYWRLM